jgi:hypothetical protein
MDIKNQGWLRFSMGQVLEQFEMIINTLKKPAHFPNICREDGSGTVTKK